MDYPFWDIGIGYGWLMASVAVLHVFISHFAIGGGFFLVITETMARKAGDQVKLQFLKKLSKFFVMVSVVLGALTGVGIWFVIGLLNPAATEALIHHFVWGWAIEWTFFVVEILAALLYFYGWDRMTAKAHLTLGWIYFIAAWLSLAVINGILSFMLTPGGWLSSGNFWAGILNPTYFSSLVFRTGVCIMVAGLYAMLVGAFTTKGNDRVKTVRYSSFWGLAGLIIMAPSFYWFLSDIPNGIMDNVAAMMPFVGARLNDTWYYAIPLLAIIVIVGIGLPKGYCRTLGIITMALGLVWFGQFEWLRESIRKPYIIYDYMYGNGLELSKAETYKTDGLLPHMKYKTDNPGADLFRHTCRSCHTIDGYKPLKPSFDGTDADFIAAIVRGTDLMKGNMPPWLGTEEESLQLGQYLKAHMSEETLASLYELSGVELGRKVYEIRCGNCHELGGYNDKTASLTGLEESDYNDILDMAEDLGDGMPAFTAPDNEREALIQFLMTLEEGGNDATSEL